MEQLTGRFADIISWMHLASAAMTRFAAEGRRKEDRPFFDWAMEHAFEEMQRGFDGLFANMKVPGGTWAFRGPLALWSRLNRLSGGPSDGLGHAVAKALQTPGAVRDGILPGLYVPNDPEHPLGRMEHALVVCSEAEDVARKLKDAVKRRDLPKAHPAALIPQAVEKGIITEAEAQLLRHAEEVREDAIQVDAFTLEEYMETATDPDGYAGGDGAARASDVLREALSNAEGVPERVPGDGADDLADAGAAAWGAAVETDDPAV